MVRMCTYVSLRLLGTFFVCNACHCICILSPFTFEAIVEGANLSCIVISQIKGKKEGHWLTLHAVVLQCFISFHDSISWNSHPREFWPNQCWDHLKNKNTSVYLFFLNTYFGYVCKRSPHIMTRIMKQSVTVCQNSVRTSLFSRKINVV